jgi:predicted dehydrogenase
MLKVGVVGAGHLGKIHLKCLLELSDVVQLVGFYDEDVARRELVAGELGIKAFTRQEDLIEAVDIVDIVTPTIYHFAVAQQAVRKGKHVFIEKPVTATLDEANELAALVEQFNVKAQVGHVERFNPAVLGLKDRKIKPMFIEAHRLAMFNPRGTDVSVVLDLMIHDLDLVLHWIKSPIKNVHASGVAVVSETPDIANARIEFENGCVANLTASRISMKQMRKVRLFQKDTYISLDLLEKQTQVIEISDHAPADDNQTFPLETLTGTKYITIDMPEVQQINAIKEELRSFVDSIEHNLPIKVSLADGTEVLKIAYQILQKMEEGLRII